MKDLRPLCTFLKATEIKGGSFMQLNETVRAYDLAEALRGECGKFEVVTSQGTRLIVTCLPGHSIANLCVATEGGHEQMIWVKKIADFQGQPVPHYRQTAGD
jgi:hypothetical protein